MSDQAPRVFHDNSVSDERFMPTGLFYKISSQDGTKLTVTGTTPNNDRTQLAFARNRFEVPTGAIQADESSSENVEVVGLQIVRRRSGITYVAWKQSDGEYNIFPVPPEALQLADDFVAVV